MNQNEQKHIDSFVSVIFEESEALQRAARISDFTDVDEIIAAILGVKGKLVTTGIGKSGHIANKIASTFASTGTSAFFLHPSEALHGDLGMISQQDILLAIGYSGESAEVVDVAKYARRLGVPVVAFTGSHGSSLGKVADYIIGVEIEKEACPLNLAPTSSTTLTLALGDALAISVMKARDFAKCDFARVHPGGKLGRQLAHVSNYMRDLQETSRLVSSDNFYKVLAAITQNNLGLAVVEDSKGSLGVITDGDLRRAMISSGEGVFTKSAADLMSRNAITISDRELAIDALKIMERNMITALVVVRSEKPLMPIGILKLQDLLSAKLI